MQLFYLILTRVLFPFFVGSPKVLPAAVGDQVSRPAVGNLVSNDLVRETITGER